jgi:hypothetical protein
VGLSHGKEEWEGGKGPPEPEVTREPTGPPLKLSVALNRCPFCHDDLSAESAGWVACRKCLARHHRDCWLEAGRCSACGSVERVERSRRKALVVGLVVLLGCGVILGAVVRKWSGERPRGSAEERATICSWANVTPGTSFKSVATRRIGGAYPSESETTSVSTLLTKTSAGVTVHLNIVDVLRALPRPAAPSAPVQGPRETKIDRDATYDIEFDMKAMLGTITSHTRETIDVPAGRFECEHFLGRTPPHLDRGQTESSAEVWFAADLPRPVKSISRNAEVETITVLTEIKKP